eukprot:CAMPEP_0197606172 /NCGR_PEP_ID=MMETSP1326-20131121/44506_1 /TAXON_ID=1155430 /ORGANISM="Genus nov. species nov., Strain RCC2288" /LENGTH=50 /DNA_ID=CAMNT_0043174051 /DNA_START=238 /DNA_END=386 /DNA_ORIENTATION=-
MPCPHTEYPTLISTASPSDASTAMGVGYAKLPCGSVSSTATSVQLSPPSS